MLDKNNPLQLERLRDLIDRSGKTRQELANDLGCDNSTITKHYNGDRAVTTDYLAKYATYFHVSADYLLGLSDVETTDTDIRAVCEFTGLSEEAVNTLATRIEKQDFLFSLAFSYLISSELAFMLRDYLLSDTLRDYIFTKFEREFPFKGNVLGCYQDLCHKKGLVDSEQCIYFAGIIQDIPRYKDELYDRIRNDRALRRKVLLARAATTSDFLDAEEKIARKEKFIELVQADLDRLLKQPEINENEERLIEAYTSSIEKSQKELKRFKRIKAEIETELHIKSKAR